MTKAAWYAIRTRPGSQRMAHRIDDEDFPVHRIGESIIERNCRNEGIDIYMPSFWVEIKHHRNNRIIERRLPLMVGYAFVHLTDEDFGVLRNVDGVIGVVGGMRATGPLRFHEERDIWPIMIAEFEKRQKYLFDQQTRKDTERLNRVNKLRSDLKRMMPKGRAVRVNLQQHAEKAVQSLSGIAKARVQSILAELKSLSEEQPQDVAA